MKAEKGGPARARKACVGTVPYGTVRTYVVGGGNGFNVRFHTAAKSATPTSYVRVAGWISSGSFGYFFAGHAAAVEKSSDQG